MDKARTIADITAAITDALRVKQAIECELGTFFVHEEPAYIGRNPRTGDEVPVSAKQIPLYLPSESLIARIASATSPRASDYRDWLESGELSEPGEFDLTFGESTSSFADEAFVSKPPTAASRLEIGSVFEEVVARLSAKKALKLGGFGTLKQLAIRQGQWKGGDAIIWKPSQALKYLVNGGEL